MKKHTRILLLILVVSLMSTFLIGCNKSDDKPGADDNKSEVQATDGDLEKTDNDDPGSEDGTNSVEGTTLNVMTWGAYIDWAIPEFEETYGVKVNLDYYSSEQEAINKLKAGRLGTVDVVFLGSGHEMQALNQGLIEEIDVTKLNSFDELFPFFQENAKDSPDGPIYKIPFAWGTNSFMYNADLITDEINSWEAMYDPAYEGRVSLLDRAEMNYWYTCLALGIDINDGSDETFAAVEEKLREQVPLNKTYWSTGDDIVQHMMNDEVWIAHAYSGLALQLQQEGKNIKYVIPEEGAHGWFDNLCLCADAPNKEAAMLFIDYMVSKDVQLEFAESVNYALTNRVAADEMSDELREIVGMEDTENTLEGLKLSEFMGVDWNTRVNQLWTEIKASAGV